MVNICIALYKGKGRLHNAFVRYWTKSEYSHAELLLPDDTSITIFPFSLDGVRRQTFVPKDEEEWDFICIPVSPRQLRELEEFYEKTKGQQYDWVGMIASQIVPFHIKHKNRWYCSEWIAYALRLICAVKGLHDHADMSPGALSQLISWADKIKYSERPKSDNWNAQKVRHFGPDDSASD